MSKYGVNIDIVLVTKSDYINVENASELVFRNTGDDDATIFGGLSLPKTGFLSEFRVKKDPNEIITNRIKVDFAGIGQNPRVEVAKITFNYQPPDQINIKDIELVSKKLIEIIASGKFKK